MASSLTLDQGQQRLVDVLEDGACSGFEQSDVRRRLVWTKIGRFKAQAFVRVLHTCQMRANVTS